MFLIRHSVCQQDLGVRVLDELDATAVVVEYQQVGWGVLEVAGRSVVQTVVTTCDAIAAGKSFDPLHFSVSSYRFFKLSGPKWMCSTDLGSHWPGLK